MLLVSHQLRELIHTLSSRPGVTVEVGECGQRITVRFVHPQGICATAVKFNDPLAVDLLEALIAEPMGTDAVSNAIRNAKTRQYCRYDSQTQGDEHAVCA
jgi:hypothetical protein